MAGVMPLPPLVALDPWLPLSGSQLHQIPEGPLYPSSFESHVSRDVFAHGPPCPPMSWNVVWGLVSFACSWTSVCCSPSTHLPPLSPLSPSVPCGWSWAWPGLAAPPPCPPQPCLSKHTECPSHVPVGRCTLLPRLERVYMMCSMHSPCPPSPPRRGQDGWPPAPFSPCPCPLCSRVRWRVFPCRWRVT